MDNVSFDGQVYTCLCPNWPEDECPLAIASKHKNGHCMYMVDDGRCDNVKNAKRTDDHRSEIDDFLSNKDAYALYLMRIGVFTFEKSGRVNMRAIDRELGCANGHTKYLKFKANKKQSV